MEDESPPSQGVSAKVRASICFENSVLLYLKGKSLVPFSSSLVHASSFQDKQKTKTTSKKMILTKEMLC